jgi:hypothetical protein
MIYGMWRKPLPGLGTAAGIFAVYCTVEYMLTRGNIFPGICLMLCDLKLLEINISVVNIFEKY